jgi:hypothetical protein
MQFQLRSYANRNHAQRGVLRTKRTSLLLALGALVATAPPTSQAQQPSATSFSASVTNARTQLTENGFRLVTEATLRELRPGDPQMAELVLTAGATYSFLAACYGDCDRVELSLSDPSGAMLHTSLDQMNMVVVFGVPQVSGSHTISISVPGCKADACDASVVMLERRDEPQQPTSAAAQPAFPAQVPPLEAAPSDASPSVSASNPLSGADAAIAQPIAGLSADEQKLISDLASLSVTVVQAIRAKEKAKSMAAVTAPVQTDVPDATGKPKGYQEPRAIAPPVAAVQPRSQPAAQRALGSGVNCAGLKQQLLSIGPGYGSYERASSIAAQMNSQCPGYW